MNGTWRSLVARTLGVREVAGSNPVVPTISIHERLPILAAVFALWVVAADVCSSETQECVSI